MDWHRLGTIGALAAQFDRASHYSRFGRKPASPTGFEAETPRKPSSERVGQTRKDKDLREGPDDGNRREQTLDGDSSRTIEGQLDPRCT